MNFNDVLKIAKQISFYLNRKEVDLFSVNLATYFLCNDDPCRELRRRLERTFTTSLQEDLSASSSTRKDSDLDDTPIPGGAQLLAGYNPQARLHITQDVRILRQRYVLLKPETVFTFAPETLFDTQDLEAITSWSASLPNTPIAVGKGSNAALYAICTKIDSLWHARQALVTPPDDVPEEEVTLGRIQQNLTESLLGQELASKLMLERFYMESRGFLRPKGPMGFLMIGPPSSGKTLMVNTLSRSLPNRPCLTLNMASFQAENESFGLIGLRRGYSGSAPGRLTSFVKDNPQSIIVFDKIDAAHPKVQEILVPLLSDGYLVDECGFDDEKTKWDRDSACVSFAETIVVFITTLGASVYERSDFLTLYKTDPKNAVAQLSDSLTSGNDKTNHRIAPPLAACLELLCLLPFKPLRMDVFLSLAHKKLDFLESALRQDGVSLVIEDRKRLAWLLVAATGPLLNARVVAQEADAPLTEAYAEDALAATQKRAMETSPPAHTSSTVQSMNFEAAKIFKISVDTSPILDGLIELDSTEVMQRFLRRGEKMCYVPKIQRQDDHLILTFSKVMLNRVVRQTDYGQKGGFEVTLPKQNFSDICGHDAVKTRLALIAEVMKKIDHGVVENYSAYLPKGMLLSGRPGTGKTMLARALAAEAQVPFIAVSGPQFLDLDVITSVFARARKFSPVIVFIDEIDALGVRGSGGRDPCINQLLTEIDGIQSNKQETVFVIAATNFPSKVDPALTRSGRLDLKVEVPCLDRDARKHFLKYFNTIPHDASLNLEELLDLTAGMSGADLERVCREVQLRLFHSEENQIRQNDVIEQINVIKFGERADAIQLRARLEATAFHEAGHAIAACFLTPWQPVDQITIVPRGNALGITSYRIEEGGEMGRHSVLNSMAVALAGRLSEMRIAAIRKQASPDGVKLPDGCNSGAKNDLAMASNLALNAITQWGLDQEFGLTSLIPMENTITTAYAVQVHDCINVWVKEATDRAQAVLEAHWCSVERVAEKLLKNTVVTARELQSAIKERSQ